jgi:transcriptional regulator with XRE-family HTH domain
LTIIDKPNNRNLNYFGQRVREVREKQKLLLRQVAAHLEVDTALMSKLERGERNATREQVVKIAGFLNSDLDELLTLWLADKVESAVGEEKKLAIEALDIVKKKLKK